jgi:hypothetical protein
MLIALAFIAFLVMIVSWVAVPSHETAKSAGSVMPVHAPQAAD